MLFFLFPQITGFMEAINMFGSCCFVFIVMPNFGASIHGLILMVHFGFIPSVVDLICRSVSNI